MSAQHVRITEKRNELLELMSPTLQAEVAWECSKEWLDRVWFLKDTSYAFRVQLSLRLEGRVFAPGEIAPRGPLYIVHRGIALWAGKVRGPGQIWGEDMILSSQNLVQKYTARAMNYIAVFLLSRDALEETQAAFPVASKIIRKRAVQLALKRAFVLEAQRRQQGGSDKDGSDQLRFDAEAEAAAALQAAKTDAERKRVAAKAAEEARRAEAAAAPAHASVAPPSPSDLGMAAANGSAMEVEEEESPMRGVLAFFGADSATPLRPLRGSSRGSSRGAEMAAGQVVAALKPMLDRVLAGQARLADELQRTREAHAGLEVQLSRQNAEVGLMAEDVKTLKQWVVNDVVNKLRA